MTIEIIFTNQAIEKNYVISTPSAVFTNQYATGTITITNGRIVTAEINIGIDDVSNKRYSDLLLKLTGVVKTSVGYLIFVQGRLGYFSLMALNNFEFFTQFIKLTNYYGLNGLLIGIPDKYIPQYISYMSGLVAYLSNPKSTNADFLNLLSAVTGPLNILTVEQRNKIMYVSSGSKVLKYLRDGYFKTNQTTNITTIKI